MGAGENQLQTWWVLNARETLESREKFQTNMEQLKAVKELVRRLKNGSNYRDLKYGANTVPFKYGERQAVKAVHALAKLVSENAYTRAAKLADNEAVAQGCGGRGLLWDDTAQTLAETGRCLWILKNSEDLYNVKDTGAGHHPRVEELCANLYNLCHQTIRENREMQNYLLLQAIALLARSWYGSQNDLGMLQDTVRNIADASADSLDMWNGFTSVKGWWGDILNMLVNEPGDPVYLSWEQRLLREASSWMLSRHLYVIGQVDDINSETWVWKTDMLLYKAWENQGGGHGPYHSTKAQSFDEVRGALKLELGGRNLNEAVELWRLCQSVEPSKLTV